MSRIYTLSSSKVGSGSSVSRDSDKNSIVYAVVTGNINEIKRLINKFNVNDIIDTKNRYTALHYAIQVRNEEIIRYLMQLDAEPLIKNNEGQDAFDMSIRFQIRTVIDEELLDRNNTIKIQQDTINANNEKCAFYQSTIDIQKNQNSDLKNQLSIANKEISQYKSTNITLSNDNKALSKLVSSQKEEYDTLEKSHISLKRKYQEQETIIDNLLDGTKKKK
jgi:ankyrin repeat protein